MGRLPKAGANEELVVLGVEKDADCRQVGELRALIARGTSYRMSNDQQSNEAAFAARAPENSS